MAQVYQRLLSYVPKQKYLAYWAIAFSVLSTLLIIVAYYCLGEFLNLLIVKEALLRAQSYATRIVAFLLAGGIMYFISVSLAHVLGFRLETNLRKFGIDGLTAASFRFFDKQSSGRVRKLIDDNASQTHMIVAHLIPDIAAAVLFPIATIVLAFAVSMRVGLVILIFTLLAMGLLYLMTGQKDFMRIYQDSLERLSSESVEYVRGMQVVKVFGADVASFKAFHQAITNYANYALNYSMSCKRAFVGFQWLFYGMVAFFAPVILLADSLLGNPRFFVVELIMTLFLSGVLFTSCMRVMYVSMYSYLGVSAVDRLEGLFAEMQEEKLQFGSREQFDHFGISFDKVCFAYSDDLVIKELTADLEGNKLYALVGSSGSGKTTLAKLISGFYKLKSGQIKIGGYPLEAYSEEALSRHIAFVFQDAKLFKSSIYDNVQIGNVTAKREEVMRALHLAGCDSILDKFPEREETIIGSKGVYLSGGEKQRLAVARAILKDADIIILDEASAAVDPENEHELQKAFSHLMKGKTVIMIAHRLTSIRQADEVLVLEDGRLIERGTDAELMSQSTHYRYLQELYRKANEWRVSND
ncbi:ABC transporter ATP-binding protein [Streptococcus oriscaviae]|uniref:ABC transporter ATP-binding protein n=1 Tax=Streptococcus oriscaviae TaxID=2781599 RepID=A0ABX7YJD5_9STRE|nr:ABC transporter ATP-binding protein [Streptococcus oriscaviae]QUE53389.1 ABC transporter ATP-binding protein [Streptococcus oriscaviae]